ncbi:condensation domain-containing protein [Streptomyces neyagawaensis]|uniref:condensation domain-containing protein n=1 Tax=Streptomyces neyagawaensis TaxID=42238 RepID=UPI0006E24333|nr:condensation domain-containing protein [Streptomyces neyagawaensis]MCL6735892.1 condensation domain-containing protein [Streptomyces neyagawaensis]MDE1686304.1 condensation domain-containing protein [Streptomyces neyagawaensis]
MLMTPILEYAPEPGELVEFRVPAAVLAVTATAPEHPAPPSYVQENHIWRRLANQIAGKRHSGWLGIVFDVPGRLDTGAMATALDKWIRRHPTLLTWFAVETAAMGADALPRLRRHALNPETETLSPLLDPVSLGSYGSGSAVRDHLVKLFDNGTDPLRWPPFVAGAVVRDDGTPSTVFFAVDHTHSDGFSVVLVFDELRTLYEAELSGIEAELPAVGSYVDYCALDRERSAAITVDSPEVRRWVEFYLAGPPPTFPLDIGVEPGKTYPSIPLEMDLLDTAEAEAFSKACKAQGAGFSAGLLAALALSGYELGGHESYRGLTIVHTRDEARWQYTQGWFINLAPVEFQVGERPFSQVVGDAQRAFEGARELARVSPLRVAELMPGLSATVQSDAAAVPPMTSYIDVRHAPGSKDWAAANCNALVGPGDSREVPVWVNRLWGRTYLKTRYPDTEAARVNVPRFFGHLRDVLREIARTGEYGTGRA